MTTDFTKPATRGEVSATRRLSRLRVPVALAAVSEIVRVSVWVLLIAVPVTPVIDPATGLFSNRDPYAAVRELFPYADLALFAGAIVGVCLLLVRLGRDPKTRRVAAAVAFALSGVEVVAAVLLTLGGGMLFFDSDRQAEVVLLELFVPASMFRLYWLIPLLPAVGAVIALLVVGISAITGESRRAAAAQRVVGLDGSASSVAELSARTNGLAIASLIVVFFSTPVGLVLGHVALSQIQRTGEGGRNLALSAVILGWISVALGAIVVVIIVIAGFAQGAFH